jgi:hypothetical protein
MIDFPFCNRTAKVLGLPSILFFFDHYTSSIWEEIKSRFSFFSLYQIRTFDLELGKVEDDFKLFKENDREGTIVITNGQFLDLLRKDITLSKSEGVVIRFSLEDGKNIDLDWVETKIRQYIGFAKVYGEKKREIENRYRKEIDLIRKVIKGNFLGKKEFYTASLIVKAWTSLGSYSQWVEDALIDVVVDFSKETGKEVDFIAFFIPAFITELAIEKEKIDYIQSADWSKREWEKLFNLGKFVKIAEEKRSSDDLYDLVQLIPQPLNFPA